MQLISKTSRNIIFDNLSLYCWWKKPVRGSRCKKKKKSKQITEYLAPPHALTQNSHWKQLTAFLVLFVNNVELPVWFFRAKELSRIKALPLDLEVSLTWRINQFVVYVRHLIHKVEVIFLFTQIQQLTVQNYYCLLITFSQSISPSVLDKHRRPKRYQCRPLNQSYGTVSFSCLTMHCS